MNEKTNVKTINTGPNRLKQNLIHSAKLTSEQADWAMDRIKEKPEWNIGIIIIEAKAKFLKC